LAAKPKSVTKFKQNYYTLSEPDMQLLVKEAQTGCSASSGQLLETFQNFLTKYTSLLFYGKINLSDYDIRRFIGLFVKQPHVRRKLLCNKLNTPQWAVVQDTVRGISWMVNGYGEMEDVDQTVKMAFLQCVDVYTPRGEIPFSAYIYSYYFYVLKKQVDTLLIDQLGRKSFPLRDDEQHDEEDGEMQPGFSGPPTPGADEQLGARTLDELWVAGDTAFWPYNQLSVSERQLLKWRYVDGERPNMIAHRLTEHPNTSREAITRIKKKLAAMVDDQEVDLREVRVS